MQIVRWSLVVSLTALLCSVRSIAEESNEQFSAEALLRLVPRAWGTPDPSDLQNLRRLQELGGRETSILAQALVETEDRGLAYGIMMYFGSHRGNKQQAADALGEYLRANLDSVDDLLSLTNIAIVSFGENANVNQSGILFEIIRRAQGNAGYYALGALGKIGNSHTVVRLNDLSERPDEWQRSSAEETERFLAAILRTRNRILERLKREGDPTIQMSGTNPDSD